MNIIVIITHINIIIISIIIVIINRFINSIIINIIFLYYKGFY